MTATRHDDFGSTRPWTIEGFKRYWSAPGDPELVRQVICQDIKGWWPRGKTPLTGGDAYVNGIRAFLNAVPGFRAEVTEFATNGNVAFVRWRGTGRPSVGPSTLIGVDRLILCQGFVAENQIHSDHPIFARLAETAALG